MGKKRTFGRAKDARECETGRQWPSQRSKPWQRPTSRPLASSGAGAPQPGSGHARSPASRRSVQRPREPCPAQRKAMAGVWQDLAGSEARQAGGEGLVTDEREELASSAGREREGTVVSSGNPLWSALAMLSAIHGLSYLSSELWGCFYAAVRVRQVQRLRRRGASAAIRT
jgi:hypothetical protein